MLSTSRLTASLLYRVPSSTVRSPIFHQITSRSGRVVSRALSSACVSRFSRLLLPVSLLPLCLPAPTAPFRHVFFMAWSAKHTAIPAPLPRHHCRTLLSVAVSVAVVVMALLAILWQQKYSATSPPPASSTVASLTTPSSSSVSSAVACRECSSDSNAGLIDNLVRRGVLHSQEVAVAMKRVDRRHYITPASPASRQPHTSSAYVDSPQYIGFGATISAPHMHAMCAELMLEAVGGGQSGGEGVNVLDVGSGSGYLAAVLSRLIGEHGRVYGIEHIPELVQTSIANLRADDPALLSRVHIQQGDGRLGLPSAAPFNAIHVGAAAAEVPAALIEQLKEGGVLVVPVGEENDDQWLEVIQKQAGGRLKKTRVTGVRYVPLTSKEHQMRRG